MNEIINKFLLRENKFTLEIHLRIPEYVYSAYGRFTINKERKKNLKRNKKILLVEIWKTYLEEQMLITHYLIKHLILPRIQKMVDITENYTIVDNTML